MTEDLKVDKRDHRGRTNSIIGNAYNAVEIISEEIRFNAEEYIGDDYKDMDETFEEQEYMDYIHEVISQEKFAIFNDVKTIEKATTSYQKVYQIKKKEMNEFYGELIKNIKLDKYKLYLYMCYYLNTDKSKVFDMLSNLYKNHIIKEVVKGQTVFGNKII